MDVIIYLLFICLVIYIGDNTAAGDTADRCNYW